MSIPTAAREAPTVRMRVPSPAAQAKRDKPSRIPDSRIGLLRPVHVMQVALWEIAVIAVVATGYPWRTSSIVVACVAALVIALTSFRRSGLCAYQWIGVHVHFRRRTRTLSGPDPISLLLPGLGFRRQIDRAGNRAGLVALDDSLTAVVRLVPTTSPDPDTLVDVLSATFERADLRLAGAQLVVWSVPSPPRARYYGDERDQEPIQVYWLALRYRQDEAPAATLARGGGATGAARATATAALTMAGRLAEAGYPGVVLDEPELREELAVALGSDHAALAGAASSVAQTWRDWSIGMRHQVTYVPKADGHAMIGRYVPQAAFTCTSYSLRRTARGRLFAESNVRVGLHPTTKPLDARQIGKALGVRLVPCDGRHGATVLANLPLAR